MTARYSRDLEGEFCVRSWGEDPVKLLSSQWEQGGGRVGARELLGDASPHVTKSCRATQPAVQSSHPSGYQLPAALRRQAGIGPRKSGAGKGSGRAGPRVAAAPQPQ